MKDKIIDIFMIIFSLCIMITLGAIVISTIIFTNAEVSRKKSNLCIRSGGTVIIDSAGNFESCIRR